MPSGGRRGCRRRSVSLPTPLSRRAARPHSGDRPPRSESRPKRTSSCSRSVLYFLAPANGAVGRIYSVPKPRATPPANGTREPGAASPLLLNPVLAQQGAYPLLRLDEHRQQLEEKGTELFDFGTGDPREPTDGKIR